MCIGLPIGRGIARSTGWRPDSLVRLRVGWPLAGIAAAYRHMATVPQTTGRRLGLVLMRRGRMFGEGFTQQAMDHLLPGDAFLLREFVNGSGELGIQLEPLLPAGRTGFLLGGTSR